MNAVAPVRTASRGPGRVLAVLVLLVAVAWLAAVHGPGLMRAVTVAGRDAAQAPSSPTRPPDTAPVQGARPGPGTVRSDASREGAIAAAALDRHFRRLLREGDARQRLVALRFLGTGDPDPAAQRRHRAAAMALRDATPDDPVIAFAQTWFCGRPAVPCTEADHEAWMRTEPGNAAAYLPLLARDAATPGEQDALLRRMAEAPRHDTHVHALALETTVAFDDYIPPPIGPRERTMLREAGLSEDIGSRRRALAAGLIWAMPFPAFKGISRACRPPLPVARARDCRAVLLRMARGATLIERMVAIGALERLTRGTAEGRAWAREKSRLHWWSIQFAQVTTGPSYWDEFLRLGELEAMRRALLRAGRPLDPPPGWRPGG